MITRTLAVLLTGVIFVPSGAHLLELPAKIRLDRDGYYAVQQLYAGWAWFALPILLAIGANTALYFVERRKNPLGAGAAIGSAILILISLVIFFSLVFPANQQTANWTVFTDSWELQRLAWEYGHAATAIAVFLAFLLSSLAAAACPGQVPQER